MYVEFVQILFIYREIIYAKLLVARMRVCGFFFIKKLTLFVVILSKRKKKTANGNVKFLNFFLIFHLFIVFFLIPF